MDGDTTSITELVCTYAVARSTVRPLGVLNTCVGVGHTRDTRSA